jgi:ElaB/YqjD/DUF883 family membrane-anchored ribosome-binding protein
VTERYDDARTEAEDAGMTGEEAIEAAEIRAEIEDTRAEMGGTLTELGDRLEPGHLINQAKENVREATIGRVEETAKGVTDMVMDTIKRNPIPAAMAGAGLALLWANRSSGQPGSNGSQYGDYRRYEAAPTRRSDGPGIGDRIGQGAAGVGEAVGSAAGQVGETVGQVGQNVGQAAGQVTGQLDRFMQASPLAMAAVAAGAGAVVGALVPETAPEREMLGDASRQIGTAVRDTVGQATTKAEEALDEAALKVSSDV